MISAICSIAWFSLASSSLYVSSDGSVMTPVAAQMLRHTQEFLAALPESQRMKAHKDFDDSSRMDWTFFPRVRFGLELDSIKDNPTAFDSAKALLNCGLSESGAATAQRIRLLDPKEDRGGGVGHAG